MFPHTITIFIYDEDNDVYKKQVVKGVYFTSSDNVPISENRAHNGQASVVIPMDKMNGVTLVNGAYIVKGEHPAITSVKELKGELFCVSSIVYNNAGWDVDNVTVSGS